MQKGMEFMSKELEMVRLACKALDEKKALDIKVIDIHEVSVIADYFVIASGSNLNQVQAMVVMNRNRWKEQEVPTGSLWIMAISSSMCLMKKTVFSMIWRESGETVKS